MIILAIIGFILLVPVLIDYVQTGLVPKMPTFIASGFFFIGAIQSFFGGLILQTMVKNSRQEFEIKLNEFEEIYKNKR